MANSGAIGAGISSFLDNFTRMQQLQQQKTQQREMLELEKKRIDMQLKSQKLDDEYRKAQIADMLAKRQAEKAQADRQQNATRMMQSILERLSGGAAGGGATAGVTRPDHLQVSVLDQLVGGSLPSGDISQQSVSTTAANAPVPGASGGADMSSLSPMERAIMFSVFNQAGQGELGKSLLTVDKFRERGNTDVGLNSFGAPVTKTPLPQTFGQTIELPGGKAVDVDKFFNPMAASERLFGSMKRDRVVKTINATMLTFDKDGRVIVKTIPSELGIDAQELGPVAKLDIPADIEKTFRTIEMTSGELVKINELFNEQPKYFGRKGFITNMFKANARDFWDSVVNGGTVDDPVLQDIIDAYASTQAVANTKINRISGAAVSEQEAKRLSAQLPLPWNEANEFKGKMRGEMRRTIKEYVTANNSLRQMQRPQREVTPDVQALIDAYNGFLEPEVIEVDF